MLIAILSTCYRDCCVLLSELNSVSHYTAEVESCPIEFGGGEALEILARDAGSSSRDHEWRTRRTWPACFLLQCPFKDVYLM